MTSTTVGAFPHHEQRVRERRSLAGISFGQPSEGLRLSWGGINGGVLLALGSVMLLAALGMAVGISAVEPGATDASSIGAGAAIWAAASLLVALFLGGYASTRLSATTDSKTGFFEGALVWVVSMLVVLYLAGSGIGMLAGGAFELVGGSGQSIDPNVTADQARAVQPEASAAAWITFAAMVLSLAAAIAGAMAGRRTEPLHAGNGERGNR